MFSLTKILLPVDFSERCVRAIRRALPVLANHFNSEITVLHVIPTYSLFGPAKMGMTLPPDLVVKVKAQAQQHLDDFVKKALSDRHAMAVLLEGDPARTIAAFADSAKSDLIMMPTHGYGTFRKLLLGSVTSKVLHDANCPVWTSAHLDTLPSPEAPLSLGHILCAIDLGVHSAPTLSWAHQLAAEYGAKLTLVHVVASLDPRTEGYYFAPEWQKFVIDKAMEDIDKLQQSIHVKADVHIEVGDVSKSVSSAAQNLRADLLVIGRGVTVGTLGRFRTHASAIIRQSPCPVVSL